MKRLTVAVLMVVMCVVHALAAERPVKVYVLVGQSNMQGKAPIDGEGPGSLRSVVQNAADKEFQFLLEADGTWREREDVWIHLEAGPGTVSYGLLKPGYGSYGGLIGPELGFGHVTGDTDDGQSLLIKTCWGGKSLGHNFLPPSVGKYARPVRPNDPGFYYHEILRLVKDVTENIRTYFPDYKGQGIEIAGLCYHQGWNDQYGGLDAKYETNLAAFIDDIRSSEHGLGVPGLPVVIATSGMISRDSLIVQGQLAIADKSKYPPFAGNVAVVDTDKPYGPEKMEFKFYTSDSQKGVGYHWNGHARSYMNIGRAMAGEMRKLLKPALPARLVACGVPQGVELTWQLGRETPKGVRLLRNGKEIEARLPTYRTVFLDEAALPGKNSYELVFDMSESPTQRLAADSDTSVTDLQSYRTMAGVMLNWEASGKYEGFNILRDGNVIAASVPGGTRSYEDTDAPSKGRVAYTVQPTTGNATPAQITVNRGPVDAGGALVYEPFDYPANATNAPTIVGMGGAVGTKGQYRYLADRTPERAPAVFPLGLSYGDLPVTGNRVAGNRWSAGCAIELDDSLKKAGLLEDGATLWISYVFNHSSEAEHRSGPGGFSLRSADLQEGVGLRASGRQYETAVIKAGKKAGVRVSGTRPETPTLLVGKLVWGTNGGDDTFVPYTPGPDLKQPEKHGRSHSRINPFNIDQSNISVLFIQQEGTLDEIRVGPTYDSVVGGGAETQR